MEDWLLVAVAWRRRGLAWRVVHTADYGRVWYQRGVNCHTRSPRRRLCSPSASSTPPART